MMASLPYADFEAHKAIFDFIIQSKTGTLVFQPEGRKLFFQQGHLVFASSENPAEHFSEILVAQGVLSAADLERVKLDLGRGESLGKKLKASGLATSQQLVQSLKQQITTIVDAVFARESGDVEVVEGDLPARVPTLKIQALALIIRTVNNLESRQFLRTLPFDRPMTLSDDFERRLSAFELPASYNDFLEHIRQQETFYASDVSEHFSWNESLTKGIFYVLFHLDLIGFSEAEPEADVLPFPDNIEDGLPSAFDTEEPAGDTPIQSGLFDDLDDTPVASVSASRGAPPESGFNAADELELDDEPLEPRDDLDAEAAGEDLRLSDEPDFDFAEEPAFSPDADGDLALEPDDFELEPITDEADFAASDFEEEDRFSGGDDEPDLSSLDAAALGDSFDDAPEALADDAFDDLETKPGAFADDIHFTDTLLDEVAPADSDDDEDTSMDRTAPGDASDADLLFAEDPTPDPLRDELDLAPEPMSGGNELDLEPGHGGAEDLADFDRPGDASDDDDRDLDGSGRGPIREPESDEAPLPGLGTSPFSREDSVDEGDLQEEEPRPAVIMPEPDTLSEPVVVSSGTSRPSSSRRLLLVAIPIVLVVAAGLYYFMILQPGQAPPPQEMADDRGVEEPLQASPIESETAVVDDPEPLPDPEPTAVAGSETPVSEPPPERTPPPEPATRRDTAPPPTSEADGFSGLVAASLDRFRNQNKPYSIALILACQAETVENYLAEHGGDHELFVFIREYNGKRCHTIAFGSYATYGEAAAGLKSLPGDLKADSPWIKSFADALR